MKKIIIKTFAFFLSASIIAAGCATPGKTSSKTKGAAVGAVGGAVIGGIIGNNVGNKSNTAVGAIIGAAVGGIAGGIIGNKMDKQAEQIKTELPGAKVERIGEGINVTFDENNPDGSKAGVYFATGKYNLTSNSQLAIDKLEKIFISYPETDILVEGHTDNVGTESSNLLLAQRRANAVGTALKAGGLKPTRLTVKWYGEMQPKVDNATAENRALNRRVEFSITANEKMKADAKLEAEKQP